MQRKADLLKRAGYGGVVEVPWPIYWQGMLHELVELEPHLVYYVLRKEERDDPLRYIRYPHHNLETGAYYSSPTDKGTWIYPTGIERVVRFYRGRLCPRVIDDAKQIAPDEDTARYMIAYAEYLEAVHEKNFRTRGWYYPFADFAATKAGTYYEALVRVMTAGMVAKSQARYRAEFASPEVLLMGGR